MICHDNFHYTVKVPHTNMYYVWNDLDIHKHFPTAQRQRGAWIYPPRSSDPTSVCFHQHPAALSVTYCDVEMSAASSSLQVGNIRRLFLRRGLKLRGKLLLCWTPVRERRWESPLKPWDICRSPGSKMWHKLTVKGKKQKKKEEKKVNSSYKCYFFPWKPAAISHLTEMCKNKQNNWGVERVSDVHQDAFVFVFSWLHTSIRPFQTLSVAVLTREDVAMSPAVTFPLHLFFTSYDVPQCRNTFTIWPLWQQLWNV